MQKEAHNPEMTAASRWQELNDWLCQLQLLWRPVPFAEPVPAWEAAYPQLARQVQRFSDEQCRHYEAEPESLAHWASQWIPELADYHRQVGLPDLLPSMGLVHDRTLPEVLAKDMPGRKRLQAGAFTTALGTLGYDMLDWCCGKGHLSRTLSASGARSVQGMEWQQSLVDDGNRLARDFGGGVVIHCQDVLAPTLNLPPGVHGVALHACGDLHRQLLRKGVAANLPRLSFSPCCYHLGQDDTYILLSRQSQSYLPALQLARDELRLAVRETVTAPARVQTQTLQASRYRLGFDGLQRELCGMDQYLPLPSYPPARLQEGFPAFCRWAAETKGLVLPARVDFAHWEEHGRRRSARVRRHELIRHLFRRPLELWMVLDYALFLEEAGYEVRVGTFCERQLTPRNILVDARAQ